MRDQIGWKTEVRAWSEPYFSGIKLMVRRLEWNEEAEAHFIGLPIVFRRLTKEDEGKLLEPTMHLRNDQAQEFMDELWRVGLRPTEGTGSAGSLAATERHLADMRSLVFKIQPTK